jgi:hypothetical protein
MAEDTLIVEEIEDAYLLSSYDTTSTKILSTIIEHTTQYLQDTTTTSTRDMLTTSSSTIKSISPDQMWFTTFDYIIFAIMLGLSALIGIYFGFISKRKQDNTEEYLLGGKTMGKFPVSASLIAR